MSRTMRWLWIAATVLLMIIALWGWLRPVNAPNPAETPTAIATLAPTASPMVLPTVAPTPTSTPMSTQTADAQAAPLPPAQASESAPPANAPTSAITPTSGLGTLDAYFLDVDQGDSILLKGPDFTILIDAGRRERAEVVPYLESIGVQSIDLLVGTHPHADHIGQFPQVLARFPVSEVWMSGDSNATLTFERALDAVAASGAAYHEPRTGEVYQIGSARIEVLNPTELSDEPNEGSVSFRVVFGEVAFMLTGDAEVETERAILDTSIAAGRDLHAQILKLGHHGSNTSSSLDFLLAVDPKIAIWSAGIDNTYGHPSPLTLQRLQDLGVTVYGTAVDGTIVVETDGRTFKTIDFAPDGGQPAGCAPGQININTATLEALKEITQIGPARAQIMFELRPFSSVDDMVRVPGITATALEKIKTQGLACVE